MGRDEQPRYVQPTKETIIVRHLNYIWIFLSIILCGCNGRPSTDYYLIQFTPPFETQSIYGSEYSNVEYTDAECSISKLQTFENDSVALATVTENFHAYQDSLLRKYETDNAALNPQNFTSTEAYNIMCEALGTAYKKKMTETRILMRITHAPDYDTDQFFEIVTENGVYSEEMRQYIETNKINVEFYRIKG